MGTTPLVSVFLDGLRPDWVDRMPFVRSIGAARPIETEFGYSIACHASMYTGLSIEDHGFWFVWLRDDAESRFKPWLRRVPRLLDQIPTRLLARKLILSGMKAEDLPRGYFRVPRLVNVPMKQWPGMWVSEPKYWDEDEYAASPTLFELARRKKTATRTVGFHRGDQLASVERPLGAEVHDVDWFYLFMGAVDHAAHATGGEGKHFEEVLHRVDAAIAARCGEIERAYGGYRFVLWSDHGHLKVARPLDIYERMDKSLMAIPHVIDTNFARFWTETAAERDKLTDALASAVPEGRVLDESEMKRWQCWFPDGRYGDVIFYLDAPAAFTRTAWGFSRTQKSIHGYIPSNEAMSGALVTNFPCATTRLREMFALHVEALDLG
jgi:hypothetical protein